MRLSDVLFPVLGMVAGALMLAYWAWYMFFDGPGPGGEDPEDIINGVPAPKSPYNYGGASLSSKNSESLRIPSVGAALLFAPLSSALTEAEALVASNRFLSGVTSAVDVVVSVLGLLAVPCTLIGMTTVSLPRWMYPEWQRARRALRRRERAQEEAAGGHDSAAGTWVGQAGAGKGRRARAKDAIPWPPPSWARARKWWQE